MAIGARAASSSASVSTTRCRCSRTSRAARPCASASPLPRCRPRDRQSGAAPADAWRIAEAALGDAELADAARSTAGVARAVHGPTLRRRCDRAVARSSVRRRLANGRGMRAKGIGARAAGVDPRGKVTMLEVSDLCGQATGSTSSTAALVEAVRREPGRAHRPRQRGARRLARRTSDVDLVVVLDDDSPRRCSPRSDPRSNSRGSRRASRAMILTKDEIARSADCFPLLYGDIAQRRASRSRARTRSRTSSISDEHKRLRIEQELREIRIRMRRVATDIARQADTRRRGRAQGQAARAARCWALLALRGEHVDDRSRARARGAAKAYAIDIQRRCAVREDPAAAYATLAKLLDAALADVDRRARGVVSVRLLAVQLRRRRGLGLPLL